MTIKAIIFDCFGVLVGSGFWNVYQALGGDPDKDGAFIDQTLKKVDLGQIPQAGLRNIMSEHLGVTPDAYAAAHNNDEVPNLPLFDFIRSELRPKYKLGILSNAGPGVIERRIPSELLDLFDVVIVSGDVRLVKPDPAIFRMAAERLEVPPEQIIFIDDHAPYMPGAQAIGMRTILYKDFTGFKQQLAEIIEDEL